MDLPSTLNAPRLCYLAGRVFWVRAISLEGRAILMAWLDDVIPGRADRKFPPPMGSEEAQAAMQSVAGCSVLTWIALREHGLTFEQADELAYVPGVSSDERALEHLRLLSVLFELRRTRPDEPPEADAKDVSETWCAEGMAKLAAEYGLAEVAKLSIDQYAWLMTTGALDEGHQYGDLQAINDDLPRRIAAIEAARASGELEVLPSTP